MRIRVREGWRRLARKKSIKSRPEVGRFGGTILD